MTIDIHEIATTASFLARIADEYETVTGNGMYITLLEDGVWHIEIANQSGDVLDWDECADLEELQNVARSYFRCIS